MKEDIILANIWVGGIVLFILAFGCFILFCIGWGRTGTDYGEPDVEPTPWAIVVGFFGTIICSSGFVTCVVIIDHLSGK